MLAEIIHKIAAETQEERQPYRPRPSLAGPERCIRSLVYYANGTPANPFPGRAIMVFDDSQWHEELTKDWIRRSAYHLHSEQMEVDTPVGPGKIDGILTDLLRFDRVWENKAINHFSFDRIWRGQWPLDNIYQVALYLRGVRKINPDIREALLLIKNKNTSQYLELLLEYFPETDSICIKEMVRSDGQRTKPNVTIERVTQSAVEKFQEVERHRLSGTLPQRPFEIGTEYPCSYCLWAAPCWNGYEQEFQALATDAALDKDIEDLCAYYLEASGHATQMEKEKDELRDKIKALLRERGIRQGKAGPYTIELSLRDKWTWIEDLIPLDISGKAKLNKPYEVLTIRKPKKEKGEAT